MYNQEFTLLRLKVAADQLRAHYFAHYKSKIKATHAHEVVASAMGYPSKIALKSSGFYLDADDPSTFDIDNLTRRINARLPTLNHGTWPVGYSHKARKIILRAIVPDCTQCGDNTHTRTHIQGGCLPHDELEWWLCARCIDDNPDVASCDFCDDDLFYHAKTVNTSNECCEHAGESEMDDEEAQGYEDLAEYHFNHD